MKRLAAGLATVLQVVPYATLYCPPGSRQIGQPPPIERSVKCVMEDQGRVFQHGPFLDFYPYGNKKLSGEYEQGKRSGLWVYWTEEGQVETQERYENDQLLRREEVDEIESHKQYSQYKVTEWYPSGVKKLEGVMRDKQRHGRFREWNEKGVLERQSDWRAGKLTGFDSWFFESGKTRKEQEFVDDVADGKYREYFSSGKLHLEGRFREGAKDDLWSEWNEAGELIAKVKWWRGSIEATPATSTPALKR